MMDRAGEPQTERDANRSCLSRTKWEGMAARGGGGAKKLISPEPHMGKGGGDGGGIPPCMRSNLM